MLIKVFFSEYRAVYKEIWKIW